MTMSSDGVKKNSQLMSLSKGSPELFQELYSASIENPEAFWGEMGHHLDWIHPYSRVKNTSFKNGHIDIRWFEDGVLNVCYNCVDRHVETRPQQTALLFEGDDPLDVSSLTYQQLYERVCRCANVLKSLGVKKGDCVVLYLPMIVESAVFMLACARIGAIHSVVFGGFSAEALAARISDCQPKILVTITQSKRGGKIIPFKVNVDKALSYPGTGSIDHVVVMGGASLPPEASFFPDRDKAYESLFDAQEAVCPIEPMNAEDPLFILYTSGSTAKPKGVVHTSGGYLLYAALTHRYIFDAKKEDVYWCTADAGWITGHSYVVYGPLCNGGTTLIFEGVPYYPTAHRFWQIVDKYNVSIFYTAPTVLRGLKGQGDEYLSTTKRTSLRVLGTVGEPIDAVTWQWYYDKVGLSKCFVADTYWQTETGGHIIAPSAFFNTPQKPGYATLPFFGVQPVLFDGEGKEIMGQGDGHLCIKDSWPGQARTMYKEHDRFEQVYFSSFPGYYFSGDGAKRDMDGHYQITGRVDDVINVSGHRLGTNELESALEKHDRVNEAAVVGYPHELKGQGIYAYVVLYKDDKVDETLEKNLIHHVREIIGPIATIDKIQWVESLPKTRSGKVMRRILRKIAEGEIDAIGDISTLAEPDLVQHLIRGAIA